MNVQTQWNRRTVLSVAGAGILASSGGCLDVIAGNGAAEFGASPSRVDPPTVDETGYEFTGVEDVVIEREFEVAGERRSVRVTNYRSEYEKSIDMGLLGHQRGAVFSSLTTPQVRVLGREFNPVADMSTADLAEMVQDQYDGIESLEHRDDGEVSIHGETTTQSEFHAEATFGGELVDLSLHISEPVEMAGDFVVTVGGYPALTPGEAGNILRLMEAVEPDE